MGKGIELRAEPVVTVHYSFIEYILFQKERHEASLGWLRRRRLASGSLARTSRLPVGAALLHGNAPHSRLNVHSA